MFHFHTWLAVVYPFDKNDLVYTDILLVSLCFGHRGSNTLQHIDLWELNFLSQRNSSQGYNLYNSQVLHSWEYLRIFPTDKEMGYQFQMDSNAQLDSQTGQELWNYHCSNSPLNNFPEGQPLPHVGKTVQVYMGEGDMNLEDRSGQLDKYHLRK